MDFGRPRNRSHPRGFRAAEAGAARPQDAWFEVEYGSKDYAVNRRTKHEVTGPNPAPAMVLLATDSEGRSVLKAPTVGAFVICWLVDDPVLEEGRLPLLAVQHGRCSRGHAQRVPGVSMDAGLDAIDQQAVSSVRSTHRLERTPRARYASRVAQLRMWMSRDDRQVRRRNRRAKSAH